jgi:hypothetical protein
MYSALPGWLDVGESVHATCCSGVEDQTPTSSYDVYRQTLQQTAATDTSGAAHIHLSVDDRGGRQLLASGQLLTFTSQMVCIAQHGKHALPVCMSIHSARSSIPEAMKAFYLLSDWLCSLQGAASHYIAMMYNNQCSHMLADSCLGADVCSKCTWL